MLDWFRPDGYYQSLADIDFQRLGQMGLRYVLLDMDNTLIHHGRRQRTAFSARQIQRIHAAGMQPIIFSNAVRERVEPFAREHQVDFVCMAHKPGQRGLHQWMEKVAASPEQVMMIGDQLFTDVFCGKRGNLLTYLVHPLNPKEKWYIRMKRLFESVLKRRLQLQPRRRPRVRKRSFKQTMLSLHLPSLPLWMKKKPYPRLRSSVVNPRWILMENRKRNYL